MKRFLVGICAAQFLCHAFPGDPLLISDPVDHTVAQRCLEKESADRSLERAKPRWLAAHTKPVTAQDVRNFVRSGVVDITRSDVRHKSVLVELLLSGLATPEAVRELILEGADPLARTTNKQAQELTGYSAFANALSVAEKLNDPAILAMIKSMAVVYAPTSTRIARLVGYWNCSLDAQDPETGETALMRSIQAGAYELADFLCANGANPDLQTTTGKTVLSYAEEAEDSEVIEYLKKYTKKYRSPSENAQLRISSAVPLDHGQHVVINTISSTLMWLIDEGSHAQREQAEKIMAVEKHLDTLIRQRFERIFVASAGLDDQSQTFFQYCAHVLAHVRSQIGFVQISGLSVIGVHDSVLAKNLASKMRAIQDLTNIITLGEVTNDNKVGLQTRLELVAKDLNQFAHIKLVSTGESVRDLLLAETTALEAQLQKKARALSLRRVRFTLPVNE